LEFQNDASEPDAQKAVIAEAAQAVYDMSGSNRKESGKTRKKKKMMMKRHAVGTAKAALDTANEIQANHSVEQKIKDKRNSTGDVPDPAKVTQVPTPVVTSTDGHKSKNRKMKKGADNTHDSTKKRKRVSAFQAELLNNGESDVLAGAAVHQNTEARMDGVIVDMEQIRKPNHVTEEPLKKKAKPKRKSEVLSDTETPQGKIDISPTKPINNVVSGESTSKRKSNAGNGRQILQTKGSASCEPPATSSPYARALKHTPVPLPVPQKSFLRTTTNAGSPEQRHVQDTEVLVTETPPARVSRGVINTWNAPVPFTLLRTVEPTTVRKKSKKAPDILLSSPTTDEGDQLPISTPEVLLEKQKNVGGPSRQASLTSSNLLRYTQPLNDEPKARPRRAASVSSASSMSIKEAIARMGKPSPGSRTEMNAFFMPNNKSREAHKEADTQVFDKSFHAAQQTVNFTHEIEHLHSHLLWRTENEAAGPLPCLKKATGCSAKSEQILHLLKDDTTSNLLKLTVSTDAESIAFDAAIRDSLEAEKFLHNAIIARVPVPMDKLEGVYTLYCPKYAETHIDKYGFGQRTLSISRPSGFTSNTYTARLSIPPRPMAYTILAFTPPPHASFRTTILTTSAEGYTMTLVCLGNGYLLLRVDLALLLTGKKSDVDGDVCMEFVCVRERDVDGRAAVKWGAMEASLKAAKKVVDAKKAKEEVLRAEKEKGEKKAGKVNLSPKKRGRPSNAELARRVQEKETVTRGQA
jgi:hypothetical protein